MYTKKLLAAIAPIMSFSLTTAALADNQPASPAQIPNAALSRPQTAPGTDKGGTTAKILNRPEMAPFKRIQTYAWKFRQKLSNLQAVLDQANRVKAITTPECKKLQSELDHLCEVEPSLARGGWKDSDIEAFDKEIAKYQAHFEKSNGGGGMPAQISAPAGQAAAKDIAASTKAAAAAAKDAASTTKSTALKK